MKGNEKLITTLNALLADELSAINQYMVHSLMCDDWGYEKLHLHFEKRAIAAYNQAIVLAGDVKDFATHDVLQQILNDEDVHIDGIEGLQSQIEQMTLQVFLTTQGGNSK